MPRLNKWRALDTHADNQPSVRAQKEYVIRRNPDALQPGVGGFFTVYVAFPRGSHDGHLKNNSGDAAGPLSGQMARLLARLTSLQQSPYNRQ